MSRSIRKKLIFIYPLIIVIPLVILLSIFNTPLIVFPHPEYRDRMNVYSDHELGGNSEVIDFDILDDNIIFTYMLKSSPISAFAGMSMDVSLLDITTYDIMELEISATSPAHMLLTLMCFLEGRSRLSELDTFIHYNTVIDVKEAHQVYRIDLNHLAKTAYAKMSGEKAVTGREKRPEQLLFIHLKEMVNVDNREGNAGSFNKVKTIIIEEITFSRSYVLYYIVIGIGVVLYYGLYLIFLLVRQQKRNSSPGSSPTHLPPIHLEVETYEEEDVRKIMNIFQEHVFEPEFSIHVVYNKTGQSQARIAGLIKDKYSLSFKQLMNAIRLNEAKRLLTESDLKIYDIAFKIGYNNNTYFCKLFKKEFGLTPKEFRQQHI